jgi:hypothetical protein
VDAKVGRGSESGWLTISWVATEKNFGRDPISLSYAKDAQGPWIPIASHIANSGSYRWHMPEEVPYKFVVRVEATDEAGNVGALVSQQVIVDLAQPKGVILGVQPAEKDATPPHAYPSAPQISDKSKGDGEH